MTAYYTSRVFFQNTFYKSSHSEFILESVEAGREGLDAAVFPIVKRSVIQALAYPRRPVFFLFAFVIPLRLPGGCKSSGQENLPFDDIVIFVSKRNVGLS